MKRFITYCFVSLLPVFTFASIPGNSNELFHHQGKMDTATFAAGCFWCVQAQFSQLKGVEKVEAGFSGGFVKNPTYEEVCTGKTGHAEACNIIYDPSVISYDELLAGFFTGHDPPQR